MKKSEMNLIMVGLGAAYPRAFPKTKAELHAVAMVWYADLGHLDAGLVERAAAHMRKRCEWPSIAELWRSVMLVCGLPDYFTVKQEIVAHLAPMNKDLSMFAKRVFLGYGNRYDHRHADRYYDQTLRKCYDEALQWWMSRWTLPEYSDKLMQFFNTKQLTEG